MNLSKKEKVPLFYLIGFLSLVTNDNYSTLSQYITPSLSIWFFSVRRFCFQQNIQTMQWKDTDYLGTDLDIKSQPPEM